MSRTVVALSRQETRVRTSEATHVGSLATIDSGSRANRTENHVTVKLEHRYATACEITRDRILLPHNNHIANNLRPCVSISSWIMVSMTREAVDGLYLADGHHDHGACSYDVSTLKPLFEILREVERR
ncbi:hypothetical protein K503DRAFT_457689 [Rhizopogon vinicolor AM-OR11-026]|uniref:Uncharacterized protein n=1 Tax=Rhizopogon vinicolor AM-OR11-026 TaxID=1314800 RepID=A0A1B7NAE2_9AGAM|nr:hypothetical protein K503DRAFT_457689 [Rhizopogon vinicolor AM-OR11-026]